MALVNAFALSNRGLSAPAKTHSRGGVAVLSAAVGALLLISTTVSAQVANRVVGPTDPATGFPVGLIDENGVSPLRAPPISCCAWPVRRCPI